MGYRRLGRRTNHRRAMLRNSVTSLLKAERMVTTETRAKEIKRVTEKMITLGKRGDLHARRQALAYLYDEGIVFKLFENVGPRYADRQGGYTRLIRMGYRQGDGAPMAMLELV